MQLVCSYHTKVMNMAIQLANGQIDKDQWVTSNKDLVENYMEEVQKLPL
jgi:hypothetical protein